MDLDELNALWAEDCKIDDTDLTGELRRIPVLHNKYYNFYVRTGLKVSKLKSELVVLVKENRIIIELITLFSYLFCSFLILSSLSWLVAALVKSKLKIAVLKRRFQLTIKQQVHGTIIFFSIFSF